MDTKIASANKRAMDSSEKILFHPEWLSIWKTSPYYAFPIYMEISPVGYCNHRCKFCAFDYLGYGKDKLDKNIIIERIGEMARMGVKAIQFAGEGEPLLHPDLAEIMINTRKCGAEISMLTNGVAMSSRFIEQALGSITWFQTSIDAGKKESYAKIHGTRSDDFQKVTNNLKYAVSYRNKHMLDCEIGAQMLLIPENYMEAVELAKILVDIGVDYFTLKPYSHHPLSAHNDIISGNNFYQKIIEVENEIKNVVSGLIEVDFRKTAMKEIESTRTYERCYSTPTAWGYLTSKGDLYSCSAYLGDERFLLGNIYQESFKRIWYGERRKEHLLCMEGFDVEKNCRRVCRMNRTNETLYELRQGKKIIPVEKPGRVNFI
ncbi:TPA: radical SAM protein [Patescibacteria group bacterium]|nr:MAG: Radical SAM domain protein [Parcubacteria group bacterium GW2011_GWF2_40_10]KKR46907.1 MAG: Radical SAM domain protein [Parcubacteria group bacterium GW2011_GWA2_40_143]KKR58894.1 MAG: Radical SAM domain protein [Parcubacteria group bacterium GW2011_GWC2_40_31]KKR75181.1 MAG: Radical SAM domain protein [Parcubacteria group bacterium GW2011_GWB2_40_8]KKR77741.1 MAG: Radical SAM domain protein [Parcubacteria group bacterium GW2011_GWE2_40_8]KKR83293.1 MAG: Radical SAM domain protein [Par